MQTESVRSMVDTVIGWLDEQETLTDQFTSVCWKRLKAVKRIRTSEQISTACMKPFYRGKFVIHVNEDFLERQVRRAKHPVINFAFILLHEILHRERRDGTRKIDGLERSWSGAFQNFVLDLFVDSTLYQKGFPPQETVTKNLYDCTSVSFMLLPPHHLLDKVENCSENDLKPLTLENGNRSFYRREPSDTLRRKFRDRLEEPLRSILKRKIEWRSSVSDDPFEELFNCYLDIWFDRPSLVQVAEKLSELLKRLPSIRVIGGHGSQRGGHGRGNGDTRELELEPRQQQEINQFVRIVKKALVKSPQASSYRHKQTAKRGIRPSFDRRSSFLLSTNTWPVFFKNEIEAKRETREAAFIYMDSSASMCDEVVHFVSSLVLGANEYISNPVYQFTTDVKPVKLEELRGGKRLTGGTKINPPLDHARKKGLEQLIVITDGFVEELKPKNRAYVDGANLFTLFSYDASDPLDHHSTEYWENLEDRFR